MYRLIKQFTGINSFAVSERYLITAGKQTVNFYHHQDLDLIGTLTYSRFPKVLKVEEEHVLLQDQTRIINLDYSLKQRMAYSIDLADIWTIDLVSDQVAIIKLGPGSDGFHKLIKYTLQDATICWQVPCMNYVYYSMSDRHIFVDSDESRSLTSYDVDTGMAKWSIEINSLFSRLYGTDGGEYTILEDPYVVNSTIVVQVQQLRRGKRFLSGLEYSTGKLKWHHPSIPNSERYGDFALSLNYEGKLRKFNIDTGVLVEQHDLSHAFQTHQIHCEHRFHTTETHLYFKHSMSGKVGILQLRDLSLDVIQLPEGNTMGTSEVPMPMGKRIYVRSAPQNNLFVYESLR